MAGTVFSGFSLRAHAQVRATAVSLIYQDEHLAESDILMVDVTVDSTALYTYYCAMQWDNGYFGLQRGGSGYFKHVHFAVWGETGEVMTKPPEVVVQAVWDNGWAWMVIWPFTWEDHAEYRLLVKGTKTDSGAVYDGWFFDVANGLWKHVVKFYSPTGQLFRTFLSFIEDFQKSNRFYRAFSTFNVRKRLSAGRGWADQVRARYSPNGTEPHRNARAVGRKFVLETGGLVEETTTPNTIIEVVANEAPFEPRAPRLEQFHGFRARGDSVALTWSYPREEWSAQEAYRVIVATDSTFSDVLFDSGIQASSDTSLGVGGLPLDSSRPCFAAIEVKNVFDLWSRRIERRIESATTYAEMRRRDRATPIELTHCYPNPFNEVTVIEYALSIEARVVLRIHDVLGREVATLVDEAQTPGVYRVSFNGATLGSGVYFCTAWTVFGSVTRTMIMLK